MSEDNPQVAGMIAVVRIRMDPGFRMEQATRIITGRLLVGYRDAQLELVSIEWDRSELLAQQIREMADQREHVQKAHRAYAEELKVEQGIGERIQEEYGIDMDGVRSLLNEEMRRRHDRETAAGSDPAD